MAQIRIRVVDAAEGLGREVRVRGRAAEAAAKVAAQAAARVALVPPEQELS